MQHSADTGNCIMDKPTKVKEKLQASTGGKKHINTEKVHKQTNKDEER
jgi:hypothetical protein